MATSTHPARFGIPRSGLRGGAAMGVAVAFGIATVGAAVSPSSLYVALSGLTLAAIILLLWRRDDPPILLLPPLFQWSEVAIVPISTTWKGAALNDLSSLGADLETSAVYGLLGVLALSVGLRVAMGPRWGFDQQLREEALAFEFGGVARFALALMASGYALAGLSGVAGPARELFSKMGDIKTVGLFMLAYWCLVRRRHMNLLAAVIGFEIVFGMTGFFAGFKNALLTVIVAALAARPRLKTRDVAVIGVALFLLLAVGTFWSAIKMDYRLFVNRGTGAQVVLVPLGDRLNYLAHEAAAFDGEDVVDGFQYLVERHGYIEFLALTMEVVPEQRPHENGALTAGVLRHITMPRFIFPDKPPLPSDTEIMARYTGQSMVWDDNTSISIGHLGELYVDFGYWGGLLGMMVIGFLLGTVYRILRSCRGIPALVTAGLCLMAALPVAYFGTAYAKLVGALVLTSAVALVFQRFAAPDLLRWGPFRLRRKH